MQIVLYKIKWLYRSCKTRKLTRNPSWATKAAYKDGKFYTAAYPKELYEDGESRWKALYIVF